MIRSYRSHNAIFFYGSMALSGFVLPLALVGCQQNETPVAPGSMATAPQTPRAATPVARVEAPLIKRPEGVLPGVKLEDVSRYVLEQSRKHQRDAMRPHIMASFEPLMKASAANGEYATMVRVSKQRSLEFPKDGLGHFYLGVAQFYNGDMTGALVAWQKAQRLSPTLQRRVAPMEARIQRIRRQFPGLQLPPVQMVASDLSIEKQIPFDQGKNLIVAKKYDEIEQIAQKLAREKRVYLDGQVPLETFIEGLQFQEEAKIGETYDTRWRRLAQRLEAWHAAQPSSELASAALIATQTTWAWSIRGSDYANNVGAQQWSQMKQHLQSVEPQVRALLASGPQSPFACRAIVRWSHLSGVPRSQMRTMWANFDQHFPDSLELSLAWSLYLFPQWGGELGEWEELATSWANRRTGVEGDVRYAQFMIGMRDYFGNDLWSHQVKWPRARNGLRVILQRHPQSIAAATALMEIANEANDRKTAQDALLHVVKGRANKNRFSSPQQFAQMRLDLLDPVGK